MSGSESEWQELIEKSYERLNRQQEILESEFDLSRHERWDFDQDTGELIFSNNGTASVIARFQFVGSISTESNTWLWSWANSSVQEDLHKGLRTVYEYGESKGFEKLTNEKWPAEEVDGWEMAAISNLLIEGKGVYRPPFGKGYAFMVITRIEKASD